jgi:hypothetical protein
MVVEMGNNFNDAVDVGMLPVVWGTNNYTKTR